MPSGRRVFSGPRLQGPRPLGGASPVDPLTVEPRVIMAFTLPPLATPGHQVRRNVQVNGRRTSVRMERFLWDALAEICRSEGLSIDGLCSRVDEVRGEAGLTPALRLFMVCYFRERVLRHGLAEGPLPLAAALAALRWTDAAGDDPASPLPGPSLH